MLEANLDAAGSATAMDEVDGVLVDGVPVDGVAVEEVAMDGVAVEEVAAAKGHGFWPMPPLLLLSLPTAA